MLKTILFIGLGGGLGSICRYLTSVWINKYVSTTFPFATLSANLLGCLLIGILIGSIDKQQLTNPNTIAFLMTGFCGGYTTFSAFSAENIKLLQSGQYTTALYYIGISIMLSLVAVAFGIFLSKSS